MKRNRRILIIFLLALAALSLGACSGRRIVATGWAGVTVNEEKVYFSYGPQAFALNLANGTLAWQYPNEPVNGVDYYAAPVFADDGGQLIVASYDGSLVSLNPATGIQNWTFDGADNRYISSPLAREGLIFAPNADSFLYTLDEAGQLVWTFETDEPLWASPIWSENCGCLYQVSMDHVLYALDPTDGSLIWKSEDLGGPMVSSPALSEDGLIVVSTFNNEVIALDEESRAVRWRFTTSDWAWASPAIDGSTVYASDISGNIYALDLESGDVIWQVAPGGGIYSAPLVLEDAVYFVTDASSLVVISPDGVIQRNQPIEGKLYASPESGDGKLLLAPSEAEFFLLALNENGVQVWGYPQAE